MPPLKEENKVWAATVRWADIKDRTAATQPARDGRARMLAEQVDPNHSLSPDELATAVAAASRAQSMAALRGEKWNWNADLRGLVVAA